MQIHSVKRYFFANCFLEVIVEDESEGVTTLVSEYGAVCISFTSFSDELLDNLSGKECKIIFNQELKIDGIITKESDQQGSHFNIRFENLTMESKSLIIHEIEKQSLRSPWKRNHTRYRGAENFSSIEQPMELICSDRKNAPRFKIINYSREGMLIEGKNKETLIFQVNEEIAFEVRTNFTNILEEIEGVIVRVADDFDTHHKNVKRYGIQITRFNADSLQKYLYLLSTVEAAADSDISLVSINTYGDKN